jgi:hypothetical protein
MTLESIRYSAIHFFLEGLLGTSVAYVAEGELQLETELVDLTASCLGLSACQNR